MKLDAKGDPVRFWWKPTDDHGDAVAEWESPRTDADRPRDISRQHPPTHEPCDQLERTVALLLREGEELEWIDWVRRERCGYDTPRPRAHPIVKAMVTVVTR